MVFRGQIKDGVVVFDLPAVLPEGTRVRIEAEGLPEAKKVGEALPTWAEVFQGFTGKGEGLPSDLARNHDHYIHGAPKK